MRPKIVSAEIADYLDISKQALHKNIKSKQIVHKRSGNRLYFEHDGAKRLFSIKFTPSCWSWQNLKGGVGKTNLSFSTAIRLSLYGAKVAVIDLDQQGNFTQACGIDSSDKPILLDVISKRIDIKDALLPVCKGIDILPSRIDNAVLDNLFAINSLPVDREIKRLVNTLKKEYDFIFIDCPPNLGQSVISAALAADHIVIPVDPEKFSLSGLNITLNELEKNIFERFETTVDIKILLNKFDARTALSHQVLTELSSHPDYKEKMIKCFVRTSQDFPNTIAKNRTIFDSLKTSTAKEDIDILAREIIQVSNNNNDYLQENNSIERGVNA